MATFVYTNAYISVNGVDLSDHVKSLSSNKNFDEVDGTHMGNAAHWSMVGLENWEITVEFFQDHATSKVDQTLAPLVGGATFVVIAKAVNTTTAVTNPKYTGTARLFDYTPLSGSVGDASMAPVTFKSGDGTTLARATAD